MVSFSRKLNENSVITITKTRNARVCWVTLALMKVRLTGYNLRIVKVLVYYYQKYDATMKTRI